jgi:hypothetical protein
MYDKYKIYTRNKSQQQQATHSLVMAVILCHNNNHPK